MHQFEPIIANSISGTGRSPCAPVLPPQGGKVQWQGLHGSTVGLAVARAAAQWPGPVVLITRDTHRASVLEYEIRFFREPGPTQLLPFPDWEILPYDVFSPHQDIISQRLETLYRLPALEHGIVIAPVSTLMHRVAPRQFLQSFSFVLAVGDHLNLNDSRKRFENAGYRCVSQVLEHGEFAVRGSILDIFPMGSRQPFRIDLFDDEVETIRTFDPETQRSIETIREIRCLPGREFPLDAQSIKHFRQQFRQHFSGAPQNCAIYRDVSNGIAPGGIEYYLPLFFSQTEAFFDYLPENCLLVYEQGLYEESERFWDETRQRYEQRRVDPDRPLLEPGALFLSTAETFARLKRFSRVELSADTHTDHRPQTVVYHSEPPPQLQIQSRHSQPLEKFAAFRATAPQRRVLLAAETPGRRETLIELFNRHRISPQPVDGWQAFLDSDHPLAITVAPLEEGLVIHDPDVAIVVEGQMFSDHVVQRRRRKKTDRDTDAVIRDLSELNLGAPVVHLEHGVGRYQGLQTLTVGGVTTEFLTLEYAGNDKLYVPVSSLHLISRYTGAAPENAPLHRLGSDQWQKARRKAAEKACDVAAELLEIHAQRAARRGHAYADPGDAYQTFAAAFPFEETPDQAEAIAAVLRDMKADKPMDRLICGDVGFGKTEVAMRAAFVAVQDGFQVAVLVPTTLLAQQHYQSFRDRFADWPVNIELLSRFRSKKQLDQILEGIAQGRVDIVIGTHKLLQNTVKFHNLGLVIIDEEHRFGVRQKERFKALRAEVDVLTLSATPIPRTLNMALSYLRDLSVIATPPSKRLAIKTFVNEWSDALIHEACLREIKRGGQVYFLHNDIETIDKIARTLEELVPQATVAIGHGQMPERQLERVMLDFYHQRFNILVCTTIIETGIDVPTANTMIINRADRFGLAQLYQLRGRVGRSHHRAYAYLIVPPRKAMTSDAVKRLEVIESLEELGAGFTLAVHDMEIRGAGELLGAEQSGQIEQIGFSLYTELLQRAIEDLKSGRQPQPDIDLTRTGEIDLKIPALIPEDYLPDVHTRLVLYKRIASARSNRELEDLQVEMIDRFGLLPEPVKNLFRLTEIRLAALPLGITRIEAGPQGGRIVFAEHPNIDPAKIIRLIQRDPQRFQLDGADKLRFRAVLTTAQERFHAVTALLEDIR